MNRAEFIVCSLAFHAALLVLAVLLPAPFPSVPSYTSTEFAFVELSPEEFPVEPAMDEGLRETGPEPSLVRRLTPGSTLRLSLGEGMQDIGERIIAATESRLTAPAANSGAAGTDAASQTHEPPVEPPPTPSGQAPGEAGQAGTASPQGQEPDPTDPASSAASPPKGLPANVVPSVEAREVRTGRISINFRHQIGWPVPAMIRVDVDAGSAGESGVAWRASADRDWIIVTPGAGAGPGRVDVGVLVSALDVGYHEGNLSLRAVSDGFEGCDLPVSVMVLPEDPGIPELPHFAWDDYMDGGCEVCHLPEGLMPSRDFMLRPEFCGLCHNPAGMAASSVPGPGGHPVMVNVTSGGARFPTGGTISGGAYSDTMATHLLGGDRVVCVTCHNVMYKPGDFGRSWELTSSTDNRTFRLARGGWSKMGYLVPKVYMMRGLSTMPALLSGLKGFLAGPSMYDCDPVEGTVSFREPLDEGTVVYVTLSNPYLRAPTVNNAMCYDCHSQNTHQGLGCLVCHAAHGTSNIKAVRETVRTPDGKTRGVAFRSYTGSGSFVYGAPVADGICVVCHTTTKPNLRKGGPYLHTDGGNYAGRDCTACHSHADGFETRPSGVTSPDNNRNPAPGLSH